MASKKVQPGKALAVKQNLMELVGWQSTALPSTVHQELQQQHTQQEQRGTYSEFARIYPDKHNTTDEHMALVVSSTAIITQQADSLEAQRKQRGLDKYRDELVQDLYDAIDFETGLENVLRFLNRHHKGELKKHSIRKATSLEDVAKLMPEITASEIAWLGTLKSFPTVYFFREHGVPTILDFSIDGIEFGFDGLDGYEMNKADPCDPLLAAGFSGVVSDAQFVPFSSRFRKAFQALAFLILSDSFIYQKLYDDEHVHALAKGDGKYKRALLREQLHEYTISAEEFNSKKLSELPLKHEDFTKLEEKINAILENKIVYDLGRNNVCTPREIVIIAGLLAKIPDVLLREDRFSGYILPFGKGIRILNQQGKDMEYVPFDPYLQLRAQQGLFYHVEDVHRGNTLLRIVFDEYAQGIEARFANADVLPLDRLRETFRKEYGIIIPARSVKSMRSLNLFEDALTTSFGKTTGEDLFTYTLKTGIVELQTLLDVLMAIPRKLIPEIKTVKREYIALDSATLLMGGMVSLGYYDGTKKEIILNTPEGESFHLLSALEQQILKDTLAHEIGHPVWENLDRHLRVQWNQISSAHPSITLTKEYKDRFVYDIAVQRRCYGEDEEEEIKADPRILKIEDFCEHFSAYVNHRREFAEKAKTNRELYDKYNFFSKLFSSYGEAPYAPNPLIGIDETFRHKGRLAKRRSLGDALMMAEAKGEIRESSSRAIRESVVPSIEAMEIDRESNDIYAYIYEQEDPSCMYVLREISEFLPEQSFVLKVDPHSFLLSLGESNEAAVQYLTRKFKHIDVQDTREVVAEIRDGLDLYIERENAKPKFL